MPPYAPVQWPLRRFSIFWFGDLKLNPRCRKFSGNGLGLKVYPKKVAYLVPCIHGGLDQDVAQYVSFLGSFETSWLQNKNKKLQKLRSHRVSVASYPSLQLGVQVPSWGTSGPSLHVIGEAYWINEGAGHGSPKHSHKVANFPAKHWINETLEW